MKKRGMVRTSIPAPRTCKNRAVAFAAARADLTRHIEAPAPPFPSPSPAAAPPAPHGPVIHQSYRRGQPAGWAVTLSRVGTVQQHATKALMELPSVSALVSEGQARDLLRAHPGDGLEAWLADQPWQAAEDGSWRLESARDGRIFRVEVVSGQIVWVVERAAAAGAVTSWLVGP